MIKHSTYTICTWLFPNKLIMDSWWHMFNHSSILVRKQYNIILMLTTTTATTGTIKAKIIPFSLGNQHLEETVNDIIHDYWLTLSIQKCYTTIFKELTPRYTHGSESDWNHVSLLLLSPQKGWGGLRDCEEKTHTSSGFHERKNGTIVGHHPNYMR